ncbi:transforming growth factor beta receptor type 3 isoform X1 [Cyclopterus lumpus]|uniref:Transforming growth factor, beta receptor III n=1 Tax=Cyclopterus lumpus TaxID=8103 RepID=A0A8C3G2M5_CYCLU|nr:transforming growth factor beta receptor type 3 isoform X1 [Cyclopterus lumpus]
MARRFPIPWLLLATCCLASAGPMFRSPCELLPVGAGHPVQATLRSFTALSGCASRGTTGLPQEVHIINLRGLVPEGPGSTQVELHLKPIQSLLRHQKPLVLVLHSPQPLIWKIKSENLALGVKRTFHVSEGSEVHFQPGNFSLSCQIQKETLPHGNEHLLNWAQKKYRAVTSFSELRMTQDIYIKVGEDPLFSDTCKIDTKFLSLNYLGGYVEPQASKGCVLSAPDKDQEVHVVELQAPNSSSAFQVDVIVDLRPLEDDAPLHRDVVLLLKCTKSVNWVIKAHSVIGKLEVVASDTVSVSMNTERLMQVSKSPKQHLPSGPQALIKYAGEHGYGPVTSYTNTPVANHFNIRLREPEVVDPLERMLPPELFILRDPSPHPRAGAAARRSGLPFPFPPPASDGLPFLSLPSSLDDRPWENGEPEEHQGALSVGLSVQCEDTRMVVSIDKESLQANGFAHANLTLQDPACKAKVNATHYTLETPLTGCLTTVYPMQGSPMAVHINSVLISHTENKDGSGRPLDYEDLESGDVLFPRDPVELERTFTEPAEHQSVIVFNCTYRKNQKTSATLPRIVPGPGRQPVSNMTFNMEMYNTLPFRNPSRQAFYTVSQKQQVFVEVTSAASDPELGFTLISCFISPNSNPSVASGYTLIETVCPTDDSVKYYPQREFPVPHTQAEKKSFSFTFNSKFNMSLLFLHCEMSLCSKRSQSNQRLPTCLQPSETCDSLSVDNILVMMMNSKTSTKPLVVVDGPDQETVTPSQKATQSPQGPYDDEALYVLDTPTVVGIAFAAFVIGALLTGALWFIYSHTGETAGTQQVQKPQPTSENSSAAHSVGSTQSTPCSSSSTA